MAGKTLGLALGSGAAKGFAHVGVLKALDEYGVRPKVITGSSMGSLIGAFYVTGMQPRFMERLACSLSWRHWLDLTVPKIGLISGEKIHQMVALLTRRLQFHELPVKFGVVTTELTQRRAVLLTSGNIADAVRASISIPGVFVPYVTDQGVFVDGGVLERVPVQACRSLGADIVIAVDVAAAQRATVPETIMDVIMQSIDLMQHQLVEPRIQGADVRIEPDVSDIGTSQFNRAQEAITAGYKAAIAVMDDILAAAQQCESEPV
ncbi:patatin-like phospholipase family protein [Alicyclobacillus pomorum]|uniref:patatin-like phospholipase family protein n=1 Tax=Alicyclobacillus pomorum TaxID=204470 RepID=UPI00047DB7B9|nr:patatin-like phospholipase family protein [Alicyclobacillus pomorum]